MNRRTYLALLGGSLPSLAGCATAPGATETSTASPTDRAETTTETTTPTPSPDDSPRRVPMGDTVTAYDTRMTVSNPRVRSTVVWMGVHDPGVRTTDGQFVVVDVTVHGSHPERLDRRVRAAVDGEPLPESEPVATTTTGAFGVPFPTGSHDAAAVRWAPGDAAVHWTLDAATRDALAAEPAFRVTDVAAPKRDGERLLRLTVANDGERDGRFAAQVSLAGFSGRAVVQFEVPAGGTRTYTGDPGKIMLYFENNGGPLTIDYPRGDSLERVEYEESSATATATSG